MGGEVVLVMLLILRFCRWRGGTGRRDGRRVDAFWVRALATRHLAQSRHTLRYQSAL